MSDKITPALTPEQWAMQQDVYGSPAFGFTRDDVAALRKAIQDAFLWHAEHATPPDADAHLLRVQGVADRIAALLPPEHG